MGSVQQLASFEVPASHGNSADASFVTERPRTAVSSNTGLSLTGWLDWSHVQPSHDGTPSTSAAVTSNLETAVKEPRTCSLACSTIANIFSQLPIKKLRAAVKSSPMIALLPLLTATALLGLGIFSVLATSAAYVTNEQQIAASLARDIAADISNQFELVLSPCISLETAVLLQPNFLVLNHSFALLAENLLSKATASDTVQLELAPFGRFLSLYPFNAGDEIFFGFDALSPAALSAGSSDYVAMARTIQYRSLVINFKQLFEGGYGAVAYYPVFIKGVDANETFGLEEDLIPCHGCVVYNQSTREKWWGTVVAVVRLDDLLGGRDSRLSRLSHSENGRTYKYQMILPPAGGLGSAQGGQVLSGSASSFSAAPVNSTVTMPDGQVWILLLSPDAARGWQPPWKAGLIAMVVVLSLLASSMLMALIFSHWQYRQLVWNMLPKEVVRQLQQGKQYAERFHQVTVLFSDIVSYTKISSEMTPCGLVGLLNRVYGHYDSLCIKHGIFKVETIGDAFMCVAGCPSRCSPQEAAYKAACMARDMIRFTESFVNPDERRIRIRVGMYSGDVTAAVIGSSMYHMCLVGDTVNVASRMESNSLPMQCHVGETTARLLSGYKDVNLEPRGKLDIKGKGLMDTFWLTMPETVTPAALFTRRPDKADSPSFAEGSGTSVEDVLLVNMTKGSIARGSTMLGSLSKPSAVMECANGDCTEARNSTAVLLMVQQAAQLDNGTDSTTATRGHGIFDSGFAKAAELNKTISQGRLFEGGLGSTTVKVEADAKSVRSEIQNGYTGSEVTQLVTGVEDSAQICAGDAEGQGEVRMRQKGRVSVPVRRISSRGQRVVTDV